MLTFFREKASSIVWVIVICFIVTLAAGTFMYDFSNIASSSDSTENDIAIVGSYKVNRNLFQSSVSSQLLGLVKNNQLMVSADNLELIQYNIFQSLLFEDVMFNEAVKRKIKVSSREKNAALNEFLIQYDLKDKKALKALLKQQNRSYKSFEKSFKRTILMQKFNALIQNAIVVDDKNIEDSFSELLIEYVYVIPDKNSDFFKQFQDVSFYEDFDSFVKNVKESGSLHITQSPPRWITYGSLPKSVMDEVFLLNDDQLSDLIAYNDGFFLIKRLDSRYNDKPSDYDKKTYKDNLLKDLKSKELELLYFLKLADQEIVFNDPNLNAIHFKNVNDLESAIGSYRLLSSQQVSNPVPHYFLAKLYLLLGNFEESAKEFQKAEVKTELLKNFSFPELFFVMGQFFEFKKDIVTAKKYYQKSLEMGKQKAYILEPLKNKFKELNANSELKLVQSYLKQLETQSNIEKEESK